MSPSCVAAATGRVMLAAGLSPHAAHHSGLPACGVAGIPSFAPHSLFPFPMLLLLLGSVPTAPSAWNSPLRSSLSSFPH